MRNAKKVTSLKQKRILRIANRIVSLCIFCFLITTRIWRMGEGTFLSLSVYTSIGGGGPNPVQTGGGGGTLSFLTGGYPHPSWLGWGLPPSFLMEGYPIQSWQGIPLSFPMGDTPIQSWQGYHIPGQEGEVPHPFSRMGSGPRSGWGQVWGGGIPSGTASRVLAMWRAVFHFRSHRRTFFEYVLAIWTYTVNNLLHAQPNFSPWS